MAKKFLSGVAIICVLTMISTCGFAAISNVSGTYNSSTGAVTVTGTTDATTSSVTLMGLSTSYTSGAIAASDITCADQQDDIASQNFTFTFAVDTTTFDTTKVYLGGTGITSKIPVPFETSGGSATELITGTNSTISGKAVDTTSLLNSVRGITNITRVQVTDTSLTGVVPVPYVGGSALTSGYEVYYGTEAGKYFVVFTEAVSGEVSYYAEEGEVAADNIINTFGDISASGSQANGTINATDYAQLVAVVKGKSTTGINTIKKALVADVSADGKINATDAAQLVSKIKGANITFNAAK